MRVAASGNGNRVPGAFFLERNSGEKSTYSASENISKISKSKGHVFGNGLEPKGNGTLREALLYVLAYA